MSRESVLKLLSSENVKIPKRAVLAMTILALATGCAAPAVAPGVPAAAPVPTLVGAKEVPIAQDTEVINDPEIIGRALALEGDELSDVGKKVISEHGLIAKPLRLPLTFNGKESSGWFDLNGLGNPKEWSPTKYVVLYHPEDQKFLKLALNDENTVNLKAEEDAIAAASKVLEEPLPFQPGTVQIGVQTYSALEMQKYGTSAYAQWLKYKNGEVPISVIEELNRQGFIFGYKMLKEGYLHTDPHLGNILKTPSGKVMLIDWAEVQKVAFNTRSLSIFWGLFRGASRDAKINIGFSGYKDLLGANGIVDAIPSGNKALLVLTPVAGALGRYFLMRNGEVEGVITPGRVSLPENFPGPDGKKLSASAFVLDSEFASAEGVGQGNQIWRLVGKAGSTGLNFLKAGLAGVVYYEGAKTLHLMLYPAEDPQATIGIPYTGENIKANLNNELVVPKSLDDLWKEAYAAKEFMVKQLFYQKNTEQWVLIQDEKQKILQDVYGSLSQAEKDKIGQDYDRAMTAFLLRETIIGSKELRLNNILVDPPSFSTPVYAAATSENHVIVWTTKKVSDQLGVVVLLEAAKVNEGGKDVWKIVQQGTEPMTVKVQGKDRAVNFSQDAGNLKIVIAAAGK